MTTTQIPQSIPKSKILLNQLPVYKITNNPFVQYFTTKNIQIEIDTTISTIQTNSHPSKTIRNLLLEIQTLQERIKFLMPTAKSVKLKKLIKKRNALLCLLGVCAFPLSTYKKIQNKKHFTKYIAPKIGQYLVQNMAKLNEH
jgi:hypothetical protein